MKPFRMPPEWIRREYEFRLSMRYLRERRLAARRARGIPDPPPSKITDNSEPWLTGPATIDELVAIALEMNRSREEWLHR